MKVFSKCICIVLFLSMGSALALGGPGIASEEIHKARSKFVHDTVPEDICRNSLAVDATFVHAIVVSFVGIPSAIFALLYETPLALPLFFSMFSVVLGTPIVLDFALRTTCGFVKKWHAREGQVSFMLEDTTTGKTSQHHCLVAEATQEETDLLKQHAPFFDAHASKGQVFRILPDTCVQI